MKDYPASGAFWALAVLGSFFLEFDYQVAYATILYLVFSDGLFRNGSVIPVLGVRLVYCIFTSSCETHIMV